MSDTFKIKVIYKHTQTNEFIYEYTVDTVDNIKNRVKNRTIINNKMFYDFAIIGKA